MSPGIGRRVGGQVSVLGHRVGWQVVRRLPEPAAYALFDRLADLTVLRGGAERLRENYHRVRPDAPPWELDLMVAEGMRSYLRYYCEAFRLPEVGADELARRVRLVGNEAAARTIEDGGSVVAFLGHLGNWDLAGAWCSVHWTHVTTVAERLEPEEVFADFLRFRESLGMTIIPLTGGVNPFAALREAARRPGIIPLLADRDLTDRGVEVVFCGHPARMASGPALLALTEGRPLYPVSVHHERLADTWGIRVVFHDEVQVPAEGTTREKVTAMTQQCADALGAAVRAHPTDWHMLQRVFVDDSDVEAG